MHRAFLVDDIELELPVASPRSRRRLESPVAVADVTADVLFNRKLPVPDAACPAISTVPRPGCYYRIQEGEGGLLTTVGRAYGIGANAARLAAAQKVNDHPYNRMFWVTGKWPFETGQISFSPRFASSFDAQVQGLRTAGYPKAPRGAGFAVIWLPSPSPLKLPRLQGRCTVPNVSTWFWLAAYRIAYDAWSNLDAMVREPDDFLSQMGWDVGYVVNGSARDWFGTYSRKRLAYVHQRMGKILDVFRSSRVFTIKCSFDEPGYASSTPGIRRIVLKKDWKEPPASAQHRKTAERVQTFIHEAAHVAGFTSATERRKYGPVASRCIAIDAPRQARWNADNYGYFAMAQALIAPYEPPPLDYATHC